MPRPGNWRVTPLYTYEQPRTNVFPGEIQLVLDANGAPGAVEAWVGGRDGIPMLLSATVPGTGQNTVSVGTTPPPAPLSGQLWLNTSNDTLQWFDAAAGIWRLTDNDAGLLALDGSRPMQAALDMGGFEVRATIIDGGAF